MVCGKKQFVINTDNVSNAYNYDLLYQRNELQSFFALLFLLYFLCGFKAVLFGILFLI